MGGASETCVGMGLVAPFARVRESHAAHRARNGWHDQNPAFTDPTVPPPPVFAGSSPVWANHCFAQTIEKSGELCLTLDMG